MWVEGKLTSLPDGGLRLWRCVCGCFVISVACILVFLTANTRGGARPRRRPRTHRRLVRFTPHRTSPNFFFFFSPKIQFPFPPPTGTRAGRCLPAVLEANHVLGTSHARAARRRGQPVDTAVGTCMIYICHAVSPMCVVVAGVGIVTSRLDTSGPHEREWVRKTITSYAAG